MTKPPIVHVIMVIDKSGSMHELAADVRGGFNQYLDGLRNGSEYIDRADYHITVTLFDTKYTTLAVNANLSSVPELDDMNYVPGGCTALNDAIANSIVDFERAKPTLKKRERVLMVIQTDGYENSSTEYSTRAVKAMIKERQDGGKWAFLFMGAGLESFEESHRYGLRGQTIVLPNTSDGTASRYSGLLTGTRSYASGASAGETFTVVAAASGGETYIPLVTVSSDRAIKLTEKTKVDVVPDPEPSTEDSGDE